MRLARWIVSRWAPVVWRESVLGDLEEQAARRRHAGKAAGVWWTISTAVVVSWRLSREARSGSVLREAHSTGAWAGVGTDVRMAARSLRLTPGFTGVAVVILALGIGATTAIFSVADVSLLRPLPFAEPDRLVAIGEVGQDEGLAPGRVGVAAIQNFRAWEQYQTTFAGLAAAQNVRTFTAPDEREPQSLLGLHVTANFFDVLRFTPAIGNRFTSHHEAPGQGRVVLLGDHLWRRQFNADPDIVGKTVTFESGAWQVIGVLPAGFRYPAQQAQPTDLMMPMTRSDRQLVRNRAQTGRNYALQVVGRLNEGVTYAQAHQDMARIHDSLVQSYPDWFDDMRLAMAPLHDTVVGRTRSWMVMLLGAVGFVLLIACANVANLLLARASSRSREWTVRSAMGASRWRLIRAALVESLLLSMAGLAAALAVAAWGVAMLRASMPTSIPCLGEMALDMRVLVFAAVVAAVTGVISGWLPAWQLTRRSQVEGLREGGRAGTAGRGQQRLRVTILVAEVGLAMMLVVGTGLFTRSFVRLLNVDLGMDVTNVVAVGVNLRITAADRSSFDRARERAWPATQEVMARLQAAPGVVAVAAVGSGSPLSGSWRTNAMTVPGKPEFSSDDDQVQIKEVTPEYRSVLRVPLVRGRYIEAGDTPASPAVVVLNEEAIRRFFDGADPIGATVRLDDTSRTVVGVVGNVRVRGPEEPVQPEAYLPLAQRPGLGSTVLVRTTGDPDAFLPVAKAAVLASIPDVPVQPETMATTLRTMTAQRRFNMILVGLFGVLAITIAAAGIYGVMAFVVTQQTREIGVRMALGARRATVLRLVMGRAGVYMAVGTAAGLAGAWMLAGSLEAFLFDVRAHDPLVFAGSAITLAAAGLFAAFVPALRAARVDPVTALRAE